MSTLTDVNCKFAECDDVQISKILYANLILWKKNLKADRLKLTVEVDGKKGPPVLNLLRSFDEFWWIFKLCCIKH